MKNMEAILMVPQRERKVSALHQEPDKFMLNLPVMFIYFSGEPEYFLKIQSRENTWFRNKIEQKIKDIAPSLKLKHHLTSTWSSVEARKLIESILTVQKETKSEGE